MPTSRRLLLSPLLLAVALASVLGVATSSAAAGPGPETRVRAIATVTVDAVGQSSGETAGGVGCLRPAQPAIASGSCVATNPANEFVSGASDEFGPFYRLESPTQTPGTAALQESSGEMWGQAPRFGNTPQVKAYNGSLPEGARGVEFTTPVRPNDVGLGKPGEVAIWRQGSPGVTDAGNGFVKIMCTVTRNTQC